jgi:hypothetical protein
LCRRRKKHERHSCAIVTSSFQHSQQAEMHSYTDVITAT